MDIVIVKFFNELRYLLETMGIPYGNYINIMFHFFKDFFSKIGYDEDTMWTWIKRSFDTKRYLFDTIKESGIFIMSKDLFYLPGESSFSCVI